LEEKEYSGGGDLSKYLITFSKCLKMFAIVRKPAKEAFL
jgi:hypothetical protein